MNAIARYFEFDARQATLGREIRGGVTTFLTMAYILFVNVGILSDPNGAAMPGPAVATATAVAAGVCCIAMGLFANFPLALASGMGLNAMVSFAIVGATGSWQTAMGLVVVEGVLILLLVLAGLREAVLRAIPHDLRVAIGAGIGLFIALIGLKNGGIIVDHPATLVTAGSMNIFDADGTLQVLPVHIAVLGVLVTAILIALRVTGAILIGIVLSTAAALALRMVPWHWPIATPDFSTFFQADIAGALHWKYLPILLSIMMVDFFDTLGTATAVAEQGGLVDEKGNIPKARRVLIVDSIAASVGGLFGCSSVTSYIESGAGVSEGARTGLHTVVVGVLFLLAVFFTPLAQMVPEYATAPALILVGFLMMTHVADIDFRHFERAIPAFLTILTIPFTFSISHGVGFGFIAYVVLHLARGRFRDIHPLMYIVTAAFVAFFALGH